MGSCVSKKAAGARGKVAAPLPVAEKDKEGAHALPPVAEEEEEEVKEVVLSEAPAPRPPPEPVKRGQQPEAEEASAPSSKACSDSASVESSAAKAKVQQPGVEREAEKSAAADAPGKKGRTTAPEERESRPPRGGGSAGPGNGRARSPSPSSAHRRQQQHHHHPPEPRPRRREQQPPVVSGIGCRSGRFSPSAARRAAESAVRRTHSAREVDMALPSRRSLAAAINGTAGCYGGGGALSRRPDPGERSGRRSDSPTTGRRAPASPGATHRVGSPARKAAAKEQRHGTPERARPRARDGGELAGSGGGGERRKVAEGALGQNPSVAMECFIFL
ncbi:translation initiation factor IF-2-like [Panicum virgatum]|uniref:Uncharacterized protein n=1 Tax=Panicum virgatum TaxID=38727 RepID=A0A8T0NFT0_PANVG|nr:translation initiation factor IF-2-like [Panicum virgatum]KAG2547665.1 hypothetical protein PVAP13_9KG114785 [Panicum virgatum]